jgi:hypothetical protein
MAKNMSLVKLSLLVVVIASLTIYWAFHHKIVGGHFEKLTISSMDGIIHVIEDPTEIQKIVSDINNSPLHSIIIIGLHTIIYLMAS